MCSVAWSVQPDGYELVFNRDERWSRAPSLPVAREEDHPVPGLCARDAEAGGTWLFANAHGLTLALMNAYPPNYEPRPTTRSRGEIPLFAARVKTLAEHSLLMAKVSLADYAPFSLLCWQGNQFVRYRWDGTLFTSQLHPVRTFLTSSSISPIAVRAARERRFEELSGRPLAEILSDESATTAMEAIHVTREDGGTVSQSFLKVDDVEISLTVKRRDGNLTTATLPRLS
jgi:hypothetical protein